mgnify:CR=1 FL=1
MKPLITIIIPVYKVEKYIDKCIESLTNQTYTNIEIILVNDVHRIIAPVFAKNGRKKIIE